MTGGAIGSAAWSSRSGNACKHCPLARVILHAGTHSVDIAFLLQILT